MRTLLRLPLLIVPALLAMGCATRGKPVAKVGTSAESIYVLRSVREPREPEAGWCAASRTGFEPFGRDAERAFSFWSVESSAASGEVVNAHVAQVAELRACFGATDELPRQNFYAEGRIGEITFRGIGECRALLVDFPEPGMYPVRCHLVLSGLPPQFAGGVLTTNTLTSKAALGPDTDPPGYSQASIATIRLWRKKENP